MVKAKERVRGKAHNFTMSLLSKIWKTPCVTEPLVPRLDDEEIEIIGQRIDAKIRRTLGRSLNIREVDAGSCNGCELEISALANPYYDLERFGLHFVASPRHIIACETPRASS